MIISRTPFRVSFFGGGTDFPLWYREHGGAVIATSINRYCYITCRHLPPFFNHKYRIAYSKIETVAEIEQIEHPSVRAVLSFLKLNNESLEIHHDADLPARAGLGASSSFTVGLLKALKALRGEYITKEGLAKLAIHIEQEVIKEAVGSQDQVSTAVGGFNRIDFNTDDTIAITPICLKADRRDEFEKHLMLFFTGFSRFSIEIEKSKIENIKQNSVNLHTIKAMVDESLEILHDDKRPIDEFGQLLDEYWSLKKELSVKVSTPAIDDIYESAKKAGATGGKLLGAGGGGFMLLFVKPELQDKVKQCLSSLLHIPFRFENDGSRIVLYNPDGL